MSLAGRRVFVTGGLGFIGSHLVQSLVVKGARVTVYDNFSSGSIENLGSAREDVEVIEGDVLDFERLLGAMRGHELVSHQAAQLEITHCVEDPIDDLRSNTVGTLHVFEAARRCGSERVVNASSACVYGQARHTPSDEEHPQCPNWAYGVSKLAAERYGLIWTELHGLPVTSLRYAIIYGEREWYGRVLTIFLKRALEGMPPVVFGDGSQRRDFTYVGDLVRLHDLCLEHERAAGEILNVSTGIGTTILELAHRVSELTEGRPDPIHEEVRPGERSRLVEGERQRLPSELDEMVLSPEKARRLLGWKPDVELDEGLRRELAWLAENPGRWTKMSY